MVKNLPGMQETWVQSLGWEVPLEKEMATHSSILPWRILWTEKPSRLQSMGSQRIGFNWGTNTLTFMASPEAQMVKKLPAGQTQALVRSLGWEDPLEKGMATHSSILAWRIPWTEAMESQRVGDHWATNLFHFHSSLRYFVKMKVLSHNIWAKTRDSSFLTSSQMILYCWSTDHTFRVSRVWKTLQRICM